ncbi:MAG: SEC-C domain-containing protein [Acidimicrobiales bacterium]
MLVEIFTALIRDLLEQAGGALPRAELEAELAEELEDTALRGAPVERVQQLVDQVVAGGPLMAVGDEVVDVATLIEHVGFAHRLSAEEIAADHLELDADLALVARIAAPDSGGGLHRPDATPLRLLVEDADHLGPGGTDLRTTRLAGPAGWLAPYAPGSLVVVSVADGTLRLRALTADEPEPTPEQGAEAGARLRTDLLAALQAATEGDGSPAGVDQLQAAGMLGGWFEPGPDQPPFGEVLAGAGLERSGDLAALPDRWAPFASVADAIVVLARHGDHLEPPETSALRTVLDAFRDWRADRSTAPARSALAPMHRMPEAALCLEEELVRADPSGEDLAAFLDAFERPGGSVAAVLDTLRALAAELTGRPEDAEAHLEAARRAAPDWFPATEALAHLHEVRGRTQEAVNLLQTTRTAQDAELQILRLRARLSSTSVGRNDPCPCGSGRKYKQCHVGQTLLRRRSRCRGCSTRPAPT